VNPELVDLEEPDVEDLELVRALVQRHLDETGSRVARRLLADWEGAARRFTKVMPRDFARVLAVRAQAEAEGLDPDSDVVWTRIMEAAHG
jgi:glutamate synthase (NADPH/NADH) large chain